MICRYFHNRAARDEALKQAIANGVEDADLILGMKEADHSEQRTLM
jgi:hypothetical protein